MAEVAELLARPSVPALDAILGQTFPVLNGQGFIRIVDYMGGDASIVQAARVSYGAGTKKISEDRGLIRYLLRHRHTTPLEMCEAKFHVRVPMDLWRQWIRHRTANVNEVSTRYSEAIDECATTPPDQWRLQSELNKQGSNGLVTEWPKDFDLGEVNPCTNPGEFLSSQEKALQDCVRSVYDQRLKFGVAREQARKDLPLSNFTEAYWKCDLHNILHFLGLRMDSHAQLEIRECATVIGTIVSKWCPMAWDAFTDYRLGAFTLSAIEIAVIKDLQRFTFPPIQTEPPWTPIQDNCTSARQAGWLELDTEKSDSVTGVQVLKNNRERTEFESKAKRMELSIPWASAIPKTK